MTNRSICDYSAIFSEVNSAVYKTRDQIFIEVCIPRRTITSQFPPIRDELELIQKGLYFRAPVSQMGIVKCNNVVTASNELLGSFISR